MQQGQSVNIQCETRSEGSGLYAGVSQGLLFDWALALLGGQAQGRVADMGTQLRTWMGRGRNWGREGCGISCSTCHHAQQYCRDI